MSNDEDAIIKFLEDLEIMEEDDLKINNSIIKEAEEKSPRELREEWENNLPMDKEKFKGLFEYLNKELFEKGCDNTNNFAREYLNKIGQNNKEKVLEWLSDNGGFCDCEIILNIEQFFEE
jgi:hypothetical protein